MFRFLYNLFARIIWFIAGFLGCIVFYVTLDYNTIESGKGNTFLNKWIYKRYGIINDDED